MSGEGEVEQLSLLLVLERHAEAGWGCVLIQLGLRVSKRLGYVRV